MKSYVLLLLPLLVGKCWVQLIPVIVNSQCEPAFVHESPLCFHDSKLKFPF